MPDDQFPIGNGLSLAFLQHEEHGSSDHGKDDGHGTECPSPITLVETFGNLGSGKGGDDVWGRGVGVCETSVLEVRSVGS
jgi:hypothetical protein